MRRDIQEGTTVQGYFLHILPHARSALSKCQHKVKVDLLRTASCIVDGNGAEVSSNHQQQHYTIKHYRILNKIQTCESSSPAAAVDAEVVLAFIAPPPFAATLELALAFAFDPDPDPAAAGG